MFPLSVLFGGLVGFALGLTGGGGSLLAVPLLVYGLSVAPREAFGVSLAAVGATALIGVIPRIRSGDVELRTGLLFAAAGMIGAPGGTWLASFIPEAALLIMFSLLMVVVASQLWRQAAHAARRNNDAGEDAGTSCDANGNQTCERTSAGQLQLTTPCAALLLFVGVVTGVLSGLFGVGGGFVIVPALVLFSRMPIHRAVATSLLVIVLVSISGVASHFLAGRGISPDLTGLFVLGGAAGLFAGNMLARRISGVALQKVFASSIVAIALFVVIRSVV